MTGLPGSEHQASSVFRLTLLPLFHFSFIIFVWSSCCNEKPCMMSTTDADATHNRLTGFMIYLYCAPGCLQLIDWIASALLLCITCSMAGWIRARPRVQIWLDWIWAGSGSCSPDRLCFDQTKRYCYLAGLDQIRMSGVPLHKKWTWC